MLLITTPEKKILAHNQKEKIIQKLINTQVDLGNVVQLYDGPQRGLRPDACCSLDN